MLIICYNDMYIDKILYILQTEGMCILVSQNAMLIGMIEDASKFAHL